MMMGGELTVMDWLIWNEIPVILGNVIGGLLFTGLTLYATHARTAPATNSPTAGNDKAGTLASFGSTPVVTG